MFRVQKIESLDLPELQPYRTLRRQLEHRERGIFVAEGDKVVRRLFESHFGVESVLITEKWTAEYTPLLNARPEKEIPVFIASKEVFEQLTGHHLYQGVLAVGKIPVSDTLENILTNAPRPRLFAALDGLCDAENLGSVIRNCAAFGVQAMFIGETCSSPFLRRSVRTSMGTIFQMPMIELNSGKTSWRRELPPTEMNCPLVQILRELRGAGVRSIAAHPRAGGKVLSQADFTGDCCIVFGSEGNGVSPAVLAACDDAVAVPMHAGVDSLNVAAATSVFLYEATRQRGKA